MSTRTPDTDARIDPRRARTEPAWRVDDQGYLHTGRSAGVAERVVVDCSNEIAP